MDEDYPGRLLDLKRSPESIWCRGRWPLPEKRGIAVVGSRSARRESVEFAYQLAEAVAARGELVFSGGAVGVDTAAHLGALAAMGYTCAVLPGSLIQPYPARNRRLFQRIIKKGGTLISAAPFSPPRASRFVRRNSYLAALAELVVVIDAGPKSGAWSTARAAMKLARKVFVFGCTQIPEDIRSRALEVDSLQGLIDLIDGKAKAKTVSELSEMDSSVLVVISREGSADAETVAMTLNINLRSATRSLIHLELSGFASGQPGERYIPLLR